MPFVDTPNCVTVELRQLWRDQHVENVLAFSPAGETVIDITTMTDLAAAVATWWTDQLANVICSDVSLVEVLVTDQTAEDAPVVTYTTDLPAPGLVAEESVPNSISLCASLRSIGRGRSSRGRFYACGLRASQLTDNAFDSSYAGVYITEMEKLLDDEIIPDWELGIRSMRHNNAPRAHGVVNTVTNILCVDFVIDSQRRRLPGRGR